MTILDELAEYAKQRCEEYKHKISDKDMKAGALDMEKSSFAFEKALAKEGTSFICECKKASPSKGLIEPNFNYLEIAKAYEDAGADCISVLTEPSRFLGKDEYLAEITKAVKTPCIRKDFTVDEYMIYQAKYLGAEAVLLICAILSKNQISDYIAMCDELGISALVEAHDEWEVETAIESGARIIGVNNRNLKDFSVDNKNSENLRKLIPKDKIFVSESGIKTREDVETLEKIGVDALLVGETLMRAENKSEMLNYLKGK